MKFDRRIFSNLILFVVLIVVVAVLTMCQSSTAIRIAYGDELMGISSKDYSANVAYEDVASLELLEDPDLGATAGGKNRPELKTGLWENQSWGTYYLCFNPNATNCVVVHLKDGQVLVFNNNTNENTAATYEEFLTHLPHLNQ